MTNLWAFLLQTLTVTITACLLLVVKKMFEDKLSPRWQYGAWSVLVLRMFIPVSTSRYFVFPLPLWFEQLKAMVEEILSSSYSSVYEPIKISHPFPVVESLPTSITDLFFVLYASGVVFFLIKYGISYIQLKQLLKNGAAASENMNAEIKQISKGLQVNPCQIIVLDKIQSAFITGILHPVLVLPDAEFMDSKIIMHELLHLKYSDTLQNTFWCLMRALHWCNPVMQYVFDRISNDMESLCDQRVLERLEKEELREYGRILLSAANDKYARAVGTSSISNGGKNIAKRIEAIARFKKYPKGMALVSVSILILLSSTVLQGSAYEISQDTYSPENRLQFEQAKALTRLSRCTTLAGAIDTYAKSLILENGLYLATASPINQQEKIYEKMNETYIYCQIESSDLLKEIPYDSIFSIYNLTEVADSLYNATILIGKDYATQETDKIFAQNITLLKDDGWVVVSVEDPVLLNGGIYDYEILHNETLGETVKFETTSEHGTVTLRIVSYHEISNMISDNSGLSFMLQNRFDSTLKKDAEFSRSFVRIMTDYDYSDISPELAPKEHVAVQTAMVMTKNEEPEYFSLPASSPNSGGSSNRGNSTVRSDIEYINDNHLQATSGTDIEAIEGWYGYYVRILWDGQVVEELFFERGAQ